jgi:hypothetical protein
MAARIPAAQLRSVSKAPVAADLKALLDWLRKYVPQALTDLAALTVYTEALNAVAARKAFDVETRSGTVYTLDPDDLGKYLVFNNAGGCVVTVPFHNTVPISPGFVVTTRCFNSATPIHFVAEGGVTLRLPNGHTAFGRAEHATITLVKVSFNTWDLSGDLGT